MSSLLHIGDDTTVGCLLYCLLTRFANGSERENTSWQRSLNHPEFSDARSVFLKYRVQQIAGMKSSAPTISVSVSQTAGVELLFR